MGSVLTFDTKRCIIGEEDLEQISNPKKLLYPVAHFSNSESKVLPGPMTCVTPPASQKLEGSGLLFLAQFLESRIGAFSGFSNGLSENDRHRKRLCGQPS
jgi:hypothetical protein